MALKMLVTFDGSSFGEKILDAAARFAEASHATVYLLHVNPPAHDIGKAGPNYEPRAEMEGAALARAPLPDVRVRELETATQAAERHMAEATDYLTTLSHRFQGLEVETLVREGPHPAEEILKCVDEFGIDLVAMATHGRTGIAHLLVGSIAEAVLRAGRVPVLLLRPH